MAQSFTYNDINNLYNQNLGRSASQDEFANWQSGAFGNDPYSQIPQSGEANTYRAQNKQTPPAGATSGTGGGSKNTPQPVAWAPGPGATPPAAQPNAAGPSGINP